MKRVVFSAVASVLLIALFMGAGTVYFVPVDHRATVLVSGTYANSAADTIFFTRDPYQIALALSAHWKDSVSVTNSILRRVIGGELLPVQAGDTLFNAADTNFSAGLQGSSANPSFADVKTIAQTPYCDGYRIIVTYAGSRNGVTNNKVDYIFQKVYYSN